MKVRLICCALAAATLLCGCQANTEPQNIVEDPPAVEQSEQEEPSSDHGIEKEEPEEDDRFPPAPPVCELDFTETESFPLPFEDELLVDEEKGLFLSTEQALYDYDTMWQLLEENYPYLEAIKRELGIDWEEVKVEYRKILEGHAYGGYISQSDFLQTIDDCLDEFEIAGHLIRVGFSFHRNLLILYKNSEDALGTNVFEILNNPKSKLFYNEEHVKYLSTPGSSGSHSEPEEGEQISIGEVTALSKYLSTGYVEGEVPYLKIESFAQWDDTAQARLEDFFSSISHEEHLIIDVRGNGGGSDGAWRFGIVPFLAQQEYEFNQFWAAKSGALNLTLEPEFGKNRGYITRYTDDSWQNEFPYISPDMVTSLDTLLKVSSTLRCTDGTDKFHGKIWVLVDKDCYSATDAFACFCKETGFATLVGTITGGNGKGASPYFMALPYSGVIVEYEAYLSFNTDGTCNGTSGTAPDIVPEEGRGALETCLMAINGELDY